MYLHLGQSTVIRTRDLVGVFDLENTTAGTTTRRFLAGAEKRGQVVNVTDELPRCFAVTAENGRSRVYIVQVAASTLIKRLAEG